LNRGIVISLMTLNDTKGHPTNLKRESSSKRPLRTIYEGKLKIMKKI